MTRPSTDGPVTIQPRTPVTALTTRPRHGTTTTFPAAAVAPIVGMSTTFITRAVGHRQPLTVDDVTHLLNLDAYGETFIPRSRILDHITATTGTPPPLRDYQLPTTYDITRADALEHVRRIPDESIHCVVTSPPYWAMRVYDDPAPTVWADGETCPYGLEQTPEGFIRHTVEMIHELSRTLTRTGSMWVNLMDTYMTRTRIRSSAVDTLRDMSGTDRKPWSGHQHLRYSAGHAFLKDGEQSGIPGQVAHRASRLGLYAKSTITWAKTATLPEPQSSRVSRQLEYILHVTKTRTPVFNRDAYTTLPAPQGGRDTRTEGARLSDVWTLPTSAGGGHGAQYPSAIPARCVALSTLPGDVVLDPFAGSGTTLVAAVRSGRRAVGVESSARYVAGMTAMMSALM